jgi:hypothetical protein
MPAAERAPAPDAVRHPVLGNDPEILAILTYLRDLERNRQGYKYRGVLGWATREHIQTATTLPGQHPIWQVPEKLRSLRSREMIYREHPALPGARGTEHIYRITDRAAAALASVEGSVHIEVAPPAAEPDPRVLLHTGVVDVLLGLRIAAADIQSGKEGRWIENEPEWRSSLELTAWTSDEHERTGGNRPYFVGDDLRWAVSHELVERNTVRVKERDVVIYRITVVGAAVEPLEWHGPAATKGAKGADEGEAA